MAWKSPAEPAYSGVMRVMNILHIFPRRWGAVRHVIDLARGQIERGPTASGIVADSMTGNARSKEVLTALAPMLALGLTLTPMPRQLSPLDLPAAWHVGKRLRKTGADVIHGHGAKGGAYARLAYAGSSRCAPIPRTAAACCSTIIRSAAAPTCGWSAC